MKNVCLFSVFLLAAAMVFTACPGTGGLEDDDGPVIGPDGPITSGVFKTAPGLTFTSAGASENFIRYDISAATLNDGATGNITYKLYVAKGRIDKADDIIADNTIDPITVTPGTEGEFEGDEGAVYSAVVVAAISSDAVSSARSGVKQSQVASSVSFATGNGTLISVGLATAAGAMTYYIDSERGDDDNNGHSPKAAWKTLTKANNTVFNPGDRILLEANSIWNGIPTVGNGSWTYAWADRSYAHDDDSANFPHASNYAEFMEARGNGGMLAPQGSGTAANPIIIDLYEFNETTNTVYFSANQRPIINGNGTPALSGPKPPANSSYGGTPAQGQDSPYWLSGAVHFQGQDYWQVRNIEISNSYDFPYIADDREIGATHIFRRDVPKDLAGIAVIERRNPSALLKGIVIEHCYIHDTQSIHRNNGRDNLPTSNEFDLGGWRGRKNGAITASFTESTVQYNIIRNVGFEGIIAGDWDTGLYGHNTIIRGNFLENVAGNAIINNLHTDTLIESNLAKDTVAAPNMRNGPHAAIWSFKLQRGLYQYNEAYGSMYGAADGEAWDVDDSGLHVIYQYNYSHHNAGGCCLFMSSQSNSIFRYNISVNDGSGPMWLDAVNDYNMTEWFGKIPNANAFDQEEEATYTQRFPKGTSLFHLTGDAQGSTGAIPLIHNNTFYIGDGYDVAIMGNTATGAANRDKRARFINNIFLKDGATGEVRLVDVHGGQYYDMGKYVGLLRNNIFWSTDNNKSRFASYPADQISGIVDNNAAGVTVSGNIWANPMLRIQSMSSQTLPVPVIGATTYPPSLTANAQIKTELKDQLNTGLPDAVLNDAQQFKAFIGPSRLRMRAQYFSPTAGSPAIEGGYALPLSANATAGVPALDSAWNGHIGTGGTVTPESGFKRVDELSAYPTPWNAATGITRDFFGNPINATKPPIGAAAGPYSQ